MKYSQLIALVGTVAFFPVAQAMAQDKVEKPVGFRTVGDAAGRYITAIPQGGLDASSMKMESRQTFVLVDLNGRDLADSDAVQIKWAPEGTRATYWQEGALGIQRTGNKPDAACTFKIQLKEKSAHDILQTIVLQTASGKFVAVTGRGAKLTLAETQENAGVLDVVEAVPADGSKPAAVQSVAPVVKPTIPAAPAASPLARPAAAGVVTAVKYPNTGVKPTVFLIGDSTVNNGTAGQMGWGTPIKALFDSDKITVTNKARGGRSSRTFLTEGLWDAVLKDVTPGDFVLMQFGHNDGGRPEGVYPNGRASLKGNSDESRELETKPGNKEVVHTYGWYLRRYIADTKAKGATPVVLSMVPRNDWKEGLVLRAVTSYGGWAKEAAEQGGALFVDLNEIVAKRYETLGQEKVKGYFPNEHTHTNADGALLNAESVVEGLKALPGSAFTPFLKSAGAPRDASAGAERVGDGGTMKFSFGAGPATAGYRAVTAESRYSVETGFGLEANAAITSFKGAGAEALRRGGLDSTAPFLFSVAMPEGFYDVTVTLGHPTLATATTVKAEARRLMLQNVQTAPGQFETRTFTVAVKRPELASGRKVGLKASQRPTNWDEKLTLEFNGAHPSVVAVEIAPAKNPVAVFIAGDSTVTDQAGEPFTGWGQMLPRFFKPGAVVWNEAQSGESLASFEGARLLQKIWDQARPNDYLLIQFGHNDQKDKSAGAGPFTSYKSNLKHYIAEARNRNLIPILVTPMERRRFIGGTPTATLADYAEAVRQTGAEEKVPVIDLNAASLKLYAALGPEGTKKAFVYAAANTIPGRPEALHDDTHFSSYGAYELAGIVATGLRDAKLDVAKFLTDDFEAFDASRPDDAGALVLPLSPTRAEVKPEGS